MKKILSMILLGSACLFTSVANADLKVAVVDVVYVLQQMPQSETVRKALDNEFSAQVKSLQAKQQKANDAAQKLQKEGVSLSTAEKTKLSAAIKDFEDSYQNYSNQYRQRENEEAGKLLDKIESAINTVSKKEKFDLVLKAEAVLYATDPINITDKVLAQVKK